MWVPWSPSLPRHDVPPQFVRFTIRAIVVTVVVVVIITIVIITIAITIIVIVIVAPSLRHRQTL